MRRRRRRRRRRRNRWPPRAISPTHTDPPTRARTHTDVEAQSRTGKPIRGPMKSVGPFTPFFFCVCVSVCFLSGALRRRRRAGLVDGRPSRPLADSGPSLVAEPSASGSGCRLPTVDFQTTATTTTTTTKKTSVPGAVLFYLWLSEKENQALV